MIVPMKAKRIVELYGSALVGMRIHTPEIGEYKGGWKTVLGINPDPACPELVIAVEPDGEMFWNYMGIFDYEICLVEYPW